MHGLAVIAFATLTQLTGSACFKFYITRDLNNSKELPEGDWTTVKINTTEFRVTFEIPVTVCNSDAVIFFANQDRNILAVWLNEYIQGKYYSMPHKLVKEMKGENTTKTENSLFRRVSGTFPKTWLPDNWNKVSAAVVGVDGQYYNYYKMQNFKISLPDLMVVEEYLKYRVTNELHKEEWENIDQYPLPDQTVEQN